MRFSLSAITRNILQPSTNGLATILLLCTSLTTAAALPEHSLLISTFSWTLVWVFAVVKGRGGFEVEDISTRNHSWAAAGLLVLAQICERATLGGKGFWWTKAFIPMGVALLRWLNLTSSSFSSVLLDHSEKPVRRNTTSLILIATLSSFVVLSQPFVTFPTTALGLVYVLLCALAYTILEDTISTTTGYNHKHVNNGSFVSANGSVSRRESSASRADRLSWTRSLRHLSGAMVVGCAIATLFFENLRTDGLIYRRKLDGLAAENWKKDHRLLNAGQGLAIGFMGSLQSIMSFFMIRRQGANSLAFNSLGGALFAHLTLYLTATDIWFTFLAAAATYLLTNEPISSAYPPSEPRPRMRLTQLLTLLALCSFAGLTVLLIRGSDRLSSLHSTTSSFQTRTSRISLEKFHLTTSKSHPIYQLVTGAEQEFESLQRGQSKTLVDAIAEYRRRYRIPPPPNFDKWFEFAKNRGVQLIDEYDTIYHSLLPFWALEPSTIRARARESLGYPNALLAVLIRDGAPVKIEGGGDWQQQATLGMIKDFVHYLPDMDIAFNVHDEPRVVVPHDDLARMMMLAKDRSMPAAFANKLPTNSFSARPKDMNDGKRIAEVKTTRFNKFAHQPTWTNSRISCSPDSPARSLDEHAPDNVTSFALGELGFLYNDTSFSDICLSPSLKETYGFFDRPNAFDIVHDLFPIFSQSKISSFQDIIYPSPWYWYGKVTYEENKDIDWQHKQSQMYWRGSTTGGFSRDGGWRRQHRQRFVRRINSPDTAKVLDNYGDGAATGWHVKEVKRQDFQNLFDVKFSHVGQCDPGDCDAQREFFTVVKPAGQQDAWASKFLLDIDGNAFSGRFYAFLQSKSLVYKLALFREWHQDWLKPWVHFIPLGLQGDEWIESVRYFAVEEEGKVQAQRLADQGRRWAKQALRNEDFEVWFFRLLLEYGRLIDDNRETIGYGGP